MNQRAKNIDENDKKRTAPLRYEEISHSQRFRIPQLPMGSDSTCGMASSVGKVAVSVCAAGSTDYAHGLSLRFELKRYSNPIHVERLLGLPTCEGLLPRALAEHPTGSRERPRQ